MTPADYQARYEQIEAATVRGHLSIRQGLARAALLTHEKFADAIEFDSEIEALTQAVIKAAVAKVKTFGCPEMIAYWTPADRDLYLAVQAFLLVSR